MSTSAFPTLAGLGWDVQRTPIWQTTVQENVSGKETRIAEQTYPRYQWDLTFDFLRQGTVHGSAYTEFSQLAGFFNQRQGRLDSFLYTDADDNTVTAQQIGIGDGSALDFQLVRTFGGCIEPVFAPNAVSAVYVDGVTVSGSFWSVSNWGSATPGVITFAGGHAPANGKAVTADFSYYWPCRFMDDQITFAKFMQSLYAGKKVSFKSVKN